MKKSAYFVSERQAQSACKAMKKAGIDDFKIINNYRTDSLRYIADKNPAGLYFADGTVRIPEIGFVSGRGIENEKLVLGNSYSSFVTVSGAAKGVMVNFQSSPEAEDIVKINGGSLVDY